MYGNVAGACSWAGARPGPAAFGATIPMTGSPPNRVFDTAVTCTNKKCIIPTGVAAMRVMNCIEVAELHLEQECTMIAGDAVMAMYHSAPQAQTLLDDGVLIIVYGVDQTVIQQCIARIVGRVLQRETRFDIKYGTLITTSDKAVTIMRPGMLNMILHPQVVSSAVSCQRTAALHEVLHVDVQHIAAVVSDKLTITAYNDTAAHMRMTDDPGPRVELTTVSAQGKDASARALARYVLCGWRAANVTPVHLRESLRASGRTARWDTGLLAPSVAERIRCLQSEAYATWFRWYSKEVLELTKMGVAGGVYDDLRGQCELMTMAAQGEVHEGTGTLDGAEVTTAASDTYMRNLSGAYIHPSTTKGGHLYAGRPGAGATDCLASAFGSDSLTTAPSSSSTTDSFPALLGAALACMAYNRTRGAALRDTKLSPTAYRSPTAARSDDAVSVYMRDMQTGHVIMLPDHDACSAATRTGHGMLPAAKQGRGRSDTCLDGVDEVDVVMHNDDGKRFAAGDSVEPQRGYSNPAAQSSCTIA